MIFRKGTTSDAPLGVCAAKNLRVGDQLFVPKTGRMATINRISPFRHTLISVYLDNDRYVHHYGPDTLLTFHGYWEN